MKILVVEDEDILRISIRDDLKEAGFKVAVFRTPIPALSLLENEKFDVAIVDYKMPEMDGITLLQKIKQKQPDCAVIIISAFGTIQTAVEAMKQGAYDYIAKPFSNEELILMMRRIEEVFSLKKENIKLKEQLEEQRGHYALIGKSKPMQQIFNLLEIVAHSDSTVLITGETGSGKEVVADAIHYLGPRKNKPYIKVSCALFSREILESELFGHEQGAFTGAIREKKGRFERADTGTLFLDDVDDIPLDIQVKLLRALQHSQFERVGGSETRTVNVRVIAASKANLLEKARRGEFREDLYYRLNVVPIELPPLRERKEDLPLFIEAFTKKYAKGKDITISSQAMNLFINYSWPGNVRELENIIERLALIAPGATIMPAHLPPEMFHENIFSPVAWKEGRSFDEVMKENEIKLIRTALDMVGGNKSRAARFLKLKPSTLRSKIEKFNL
jgi:DNA-binding NtrC family response regulator